MDVVKFVDKSEINFFAAAGKKYLIGIYELAPGQDPATADFRERSNAYQFGRAAAEGAVGGTLQGLLPVIIILALAFSFVSGATGSAGTTSIETI